MAQVAARDDPPPIEEDPDPFAAFGIGATVEKQRVHLIDDSPWQAAAPTSASLSLAAEPIGEVSGGWGDADSEFEPGKRRITAEERRRARMAREGSGEGAPAGEKRGNRLKVTHQEL